jgi:hypothetical protein
LSRIGYFPKCISKNPYFELEKLPKHWSKAPQVFQILGKPAEIREDETCLVGTLEI